MNIRFLEISWSNFPAYNTESAQVVSQADGNQLHWSSAKGIHLHLLFLYRPAMYLASRNKLLVVSVFLFSR